MTAFTAPTYVLDTHALLWYLAGDKRLSRRAGDVLRRAENGTANVLVSTVALAEALRVVERQRVKIRGGLIGLIEHVPGMKIVPFDLDTFRRMAELRSSLEIHDRMIAATAKQYEAQLITRDPELTGLVPTVW